MSATASRIALYSMSWWSAYALAAKYPDHSRHCCLTFSGAVRSWNAVPMLSFDLRYRQSVSLPLAAS
jgi:hypothetical protein